LGNFLKVIYQSKYFRLSVGLVIGGLSLYLAIRNVSFKEVGILLSQAKWGYIGLALICVFVNVLAKILRWKTLIGVKNHEIGFGKITAAFLAGQTLNTVYPARIGDLSRAYLTGRDESEKAFVFGTIALEKVVDLLCYAGLLILLILLMPMPGWINRSIFGIAGIAVVLMVVVVLARNYRISQSKFFYPILRWRPRWISERRWERFLGMIKAALSSLDALQGRTDYLKVVFYSFLVWGTAFITNYFILMALQLDLGEKGNLWLASLLVLVSLIVGITIPAVPGRIGIFEYVCVLSLAVFGVVQDAAFSYGVLLHVVVLTPILAGLICIIFLGLMGGRKPSSIYLVGK
jgi:glycosyltransferase 2 family protein